MNYKDTVLILIGYQNDYFSKMGILHNNIEKPEIVLNNTVSLVEQLIKTDMLIITTPILFSPGHPELKQPIGILKTIKDVSCCVVGTDGADTVSEIGKYGERIITIPGKLGLDAFNDTKLDDVLKSCDIENVILAGAVTSVCIDSTGRSAVEHGYNVIQLSDCTSARSAVEQDFYCNTVFPIYAKVMTSHDLLKELTLEE